LQVRAEWTPPKRPWVDPLKDVAAELVEVRAGFQGLPEALASRGRDLRDALNEYGQVNQLIDSLGLVLDSDPRRINGLGAIQPAAGYLKAATDQAASGQP
jgi:capsid protein